MKAKGSRRTGRPRIRWLVDVCDDLKAIDVKNWKELVLIRAWNELVEKVKTQTCGCKVNGRINNKLCWYTILKINYKPLKMHYFLRS